MVILAVGVAAESDAAHGLQRLPRNIDASARNVRAS
jgi:hypothetical protein